MAKQPQAESDGPTVKTGDGEQYRNASGPGDERAFKPRLSRPHRLIQNTRASAGGCDRYGRLLPNDPKGVDVRVSKPMFKAALVVMDRFIKGLEARVLKVDVTDDWQGRGTFVYDERDRVSLHIEEKRRRVQHVPTAKELREKEQYPSTRIPKWDDVPTGELVLVPGGLVDLSSDQAINQLVGNAVADVIEQLARARRDRETKEAAQRREWERRQREQEEKQRVGALFEAAEALRQYRNLTDYIEEVRRFGRVPDPQRREGQTLDEWLTWAQVQAQGIHPLGG